VNPGAEPLSSQSPQLSSGKAGRDGVGGVSSLGFTNLGTFLALLTHLGALASPAKVQKIAREQLSETGICLQIGQLVF